MRHGLKNKIFATMFFAAFILLMPKPAASAAVPATQGTVKEPDAALSTPANYYDPSVQDALTEKAVNDIIATTITDDMTDLEKAFFLFEWIHDNVTYANRTSGLADPVCDVHEYETRHKLDPDSYPAIGSEEFLKEYFVYNDRVYSYRPETDREKEVLSKYGFIDVNGAFGCLVQRCCVCEGYSAGYGALLDKAGIEAVRAEGYLDSVPDIPHTWNLLKINGKWYNADPTNFPDFMSRDGWGKDRTEPAYDKDGNEIHCTDDSYCYSGDSYEVGIEEMYLIMYGKMMPERVVNGKKYGGYHGEIVIESKTPLGDNGDYISILSEKYQGKKMTPTVTISYNGETYQSGGKKGKLKVKYVNNKKVGTAKAVITNVKGNAELKSLVKGKAVEFSIYPCWVPDEELEIKRKNGTVRSVKVNFSGKKVKVQKPMWKTDGDNLVFSGNYMGTVPAGQ